MPKGEKCEIEFYFKKLSVIKGLEIGKLPSSVRVSPLTPHPAKKK